MYMLKLQEVYNQKIYKGFTLWNKNSTLICMLPDILDLSMYDVYT